MRLPERSTTPISERIEGETWSGITRNYRLSPMVPGRFDLPPQEVTVTWRDASGADSVTVLTTDAISFSGVVPDGAQDLDPFIAASDLTLTQEIAGDPAAMDAGSSFTRTVTAELKGLAPMFLPGLQHPAPVTGLAAYPDAPVLIEADERGRVSGTRSETVTFVAEGGGSGQLPGLTLRWFDLDDRTVKTAEVEAIDVAISGPPARAADPGWNRRLTIAAVTGVLVLGLAAWLGRRLAPKLRAGLARRRARVLASEAYAWRQLRQVLNAGGPAGLRQALDTWAARVDGADPRRDPEVRQALLSLGAAEYRGAGSPSTRPTALAALDRALRAARRRRRNPRRARGLPPLNPSG